MQTKQLIHDGNTSGKHYPGNYQLSYNDVNLRNWLTIRAPSTGVSIIQIMIPLDNTTQQ